MTLDDRIAALTTDIDAELRRELHDVLRTLRDASNIPGAIMTVSRLLEGDKGLLGAIAVAGRHVLKGSTLDKQIEELAAKGIIPGEIASDLHWIRVRANKARHKIEKKTLTVNDAEASLDRALSVVEWFYCHYEYGPGLATIYTTEYHPATLLERFAELQVPTAEQTRSLQAEITLLHETLRRQSERAQQTTRDPIPIPLPALRGTFVDREAERDTLHHLLNESEMRLVVIVAPGGYGKTELTTKVLKEAAPSTSIIDPNVQGILYLRCLRGDVSLGRIFAEAGRIVGERDAFQQTYASRDLTLDRKLEYFFNELSRAGNVWLVMDNFEDLLADDDSITDPELRAFVESAVATEHKVRLIATTRAVPLFKGSQRLKPIDLREGLPEEQAIKYLRTEGANYGLAHLDEDLLRVFVNRVHRVPKALESIIGYLSEKYPVVKLADLMANNALFADFDRYDTENGLKHLVAEQFTDQTADAQLVLCALSIFPKPAPLAALRYLLPALDWATVLPRLERNRLVSRQVDRYDLHPLVREYAYSHIPQETLDAEILFENEHEPARAELSSAVPFARVSLHKRAANFYKELRAPKSEWKTISDLEPQLDEFYHRVRAEQYDDAARVLNVIDFDYLQVWGHYTALIELREQLEGKLSDNSLSRNNLVSLGVVYDETGQVRKAISCYEQALQSANNDSDQYSIAACLGNMGLAYNELGETHRAIEYHEQALGIFREIGQRASEGRSLDNLGIAYSGLGETRRAIEYHEQALAIRYEVGDRRGEGTSFGNLGAAYADLGETQRAIEYYEQALVIRREIDHRIGEGRDLSNLGGSFAQLGDFEKSIRYYIGALKISKDIGHKFGIAYRLTGLGNAHHHLGDLGEARRCYEEAFGLDIPTNNYDCATRLGILSLEETRTAEAEDYFMRGIALCRALLEKTPRLYEALYNLGLAQLGSGQSEEAIAIYRQALEVCSAKGIVQVALQELRLLKRAAPTTAGIAEVQALLEGALNKD
jgi:tetratricopeptide (TPR) repeat protein